MEQEAMGAMDVQEEVVDSSTTEQPEVLEESADSLNTEEKKSESVPYGRFKEVNDKYRQTEKELNEYREKMKLWEDVNNVVSKDEVFNKEFNSLIEKYNKGELTKAEEKQLDKMVDQQESYKDPRVDELYQKYEKDTFKRYDQDFRTLASKDFEDDSDIAMVGKMLTDLINKEHPNALGEYNPNLVNKYYAKAKEQVDSLVKRQMAKYVGTKASDDIPTNKPGSIPNHEVDLSKAPRSQVSSHLAEKMRQAKD